MNSVQRFWELGEHEIITPSQKNLAKILNALILCEGKLHASYSNAIADRQWSRGTRECDVVFRISLPIGTEDMFRELTGFYLTTPDMAGSIGSAAIAN